MFNKRKKYEKFGWELDELMWKNMESLPFITSKDEYPRWLFTLIKLGYFKGKYELQLLEFLNNAKDLRGDFPPEQYEESEFVIRPPVSEDPLKRMKSYEKYHKTKIDKKLLDKYIKELSRIVNKQSKL